MWENELKKFEFKKYAKWMMVLDRLMFPLMWVTGFTMDSLQRTHVWHVQKFSVGALLTNIEGNKCVSIRGSDEKTLMRKKQKGIFHIPILGGWRNYVILTPSKSVSDIGPKGWRIEWLSTGPKNSIEINIIPLYGLVKMLVGSSEFHTKFFGIDPTKKEQIKIEKIDQGTNGDMKYPTIPLL